MKLNIMVMKIVIKSIGIQAKIIASIQIMTVNCIRTAMRRVRRRVSISDGVNLIIRPLAHRKSKRVIRQKLMKRNHQNQNSNRLTMALKSIILWELVLLMHWVRIPYNVKFIQIRSVNFEFSF